MRRRWLLKLWASALVIAASAGAALWQAARPARIVDASAIATARDARVRLGGQPFSGVVRARWPDGHLKRLTEYRDGRLHGVDRAWHASGSRWYERGYADGREQGTHIGWYPGGARRFVFHYQHGVLEGVAVEWYEDGSPFTEFHYVAGQEQGSQRMWTPQGSFRANYVVRDGRRYGSFGATGCRGHDDRDSPPENGA